MSNTKKIGVIISTDGKEVRMTGYQHNPNPKLRAILCGTGLKMALDSLTDADKAEVLQRMGIIVLTPEAVEEAKEVQP